MSTTLQAYKAKQAAIYTTEVKAAIRKEFRAHKKAGTLESTECQALIVSPVHYEIYKRVKLGA